MAGATAANLFILHITRFGRADGRSDNSSPRLALATGHERSLFMTRSSIIGSTFAWILAVFLAVLFIYAGGAKLASNPGMVREFAQIGLGQWLRYCTGILEVSGAVGVLVSDTPLLYSAADCGSHDWRDGHKFVHSSGYPFWPNLPPRWGWGWPSPAYGKASASV